MIRMEITRRLDCKQGKGRTRVNPTSVSHEPTEAEAIDFIRATRDAGNRIAPGYMPIIEVRLYENDRYLSELRTCKGSDYPKPFRTLTAEEIAAL